MQRRAFSWGELTAEDFRTLDAGSAAYRLANARVPACFLTGEAAAGLAPGADAEGVVRADLLIADGRIAGFEPVGGLGTAAERPIDLGGDRSGQPWSMCIRISTRPTPWSAPRTWAAPSTMLASPPSPTVLPGRTMTYCGACAFACAVPMPMASPRSARTWIRIPTRRSAPGKRWPRCAQSGRGGSSCRPCRCAPSIFLQEAYGEGLAALVAQTGGILGGVTRASAGNHGAPLADIDATLDRFFLLAGRHDLDVDLHVDESGDPAAATLPHVARATIRHGYHGRVTCGHCCSLAVQPEDEALRTLDLLAEAQIAVVSLPTVNMYLQDRIPGRTPRWRGVTLIHEMRRRGITVAVAGDNCRESFYAYGDHDMVDTFRQAVRILHLDHPLAGAPALVGPGPAAIAGLVGHGRLAVGEAARLIVFNARTLNELISRPQSDRVVIHGGHRLADTAPDYSELWCED